MTRIPTAAPQFDGVTPFPGETLPPRDHNQPPLEERIVLDLESQIDETPGLRTRIRELIAKADKLPACADEETAGKLGDFIKMTGAAAKRVDEIRETIKRPYLTATRNLDAKARTHTDALTKAGDAARARLNAYVADQAKKRREEEEKRIADERAAWQAEQDRLAAEREALRAAQPAAAPEPEPPAPEPVFVAPTPQPPAKPAPIATGDYGARVGTRTIWRHEPVTKAVGLPATILNHPKVLEAINTVIAAQVRSGVRAIKGVVIAEHTESNVR